MNTKTKEGILCFVLFPKDNYFNIFNVFNILNTDWGLINITYKLDGPNMVFDISGKSVIIAIVDEKIPDEEFKSTIATAYNWPKALNDLKSHRSHAVVTILDSQKYTFLDRFILFTKVVSSILKSSNAIGIYQGQQNLIIPKKQYIESALLLQKEDFPIDLWVFIGLKKTGTNNNAYTYGLFGFGKLELEVLDSKLELWDLHTKVSDICAYIIKNNINFKDGETIDFYTDEKYKITSSRGFFLPETTLKLEM